MKVLIVISLLIMSSSAFACIDLSGEYQTQEHDYFYSINQRGCESMTVNDESGSSEVIFDGVERLLYNYDIEVEGSVLAHVEIFIGSKLENNQWVYTEKDVVTYLDGHIEKEVKWAEVSINQNTDLQTILHNEDGSIETFVDIRK